MSHHLKAFDAAYLPMLGFLIFVLLFIVLVGMTFLKSQKAIYDQVQYLPLSDDQKESNT